VLLLGAAGCGAPGPSPATKIERTFKVDWHEHATSVDVRYSASRVVFHDGRWSADIAVANHSDRPLYEGTWSPAPGGFTWNGPALVYSGLDVLGDRRLIFVPADREMPDIPFPLKPGATWRGTVSGKVPAVPPLPKADSIWVRYPVFGVGHVWDNFTQSDAVQWISQKAVQL
jgi:hypothetical protein